jgi:hypothetical protein
MRPLKAVLLGTAAMAITVSAAAAPNITGPSREPVHIRMDCAWKKSAPQARCESYEVPAGKRLVIETMRVDAFLTPSADVVAKVNDAEDPSAATGVVLQKQGPRHVLYGRRIVAEGGTKLNIDYRPADELRQIPANGTTTIHLKGYLEPAL